MAGVDDPGRLRESGPRELEPLHSKKSRSGGGDPVLCGVWCLDQTWGFAGMSSEWLTSWPPTAAFAKEAVSAQCSSANPGLQSALAGFVVATTSFHLARTSFFLPAIAHCKMPCIFFVVSLCKLLWVVSFCSQKKTFLLQLKIFNRKDSSCQGTGAPFPTSNFNQ